MTRVIALATVVAVSIAVLFGLAKPASANSKVTTVVHVDETETAGLCPFDITVRVLGSFKVADYFDDNGVLYKTIFERIKDYLRTTKHFKFWNIFSDTKICYANSSYRIIAPKYGDSCETRFVARVTHKHGTA